MSYAYTFHHSQHGGGEMTTQPIQPDTPEWEALWAALFAIVGTPHEHDDWQYFGPGIDNIHSFRLRAGCPGAPNGNRWVDIVM